jgi:hypothetical protein
VRTTSSGYDEDTMSQIQRYIQMDILMYLGRRIEAERSIRPLSEFTLRLAGPAHPFDDP